MLLEAQHKLKVPIQKYTKVVKKFRRKILADPLGLGLYMESVKKKVYAPVLPYKFVISK